LPTICIEDKKIDSKSCGATHESSILSHGTKCI